MSQIFAKDNNVALSDHTSHIINEFKKLETFISKILSSELIKCIEYAIYFHDMGKVLPYFQIKQLNNINYDPFEVTVDIPHSLFSVLWINEDQLKNELKENTPYVLSAVAYHHWRDKIENILFEGSEIFEKCKEKFTPEIINKLQENLHQELKKLNNNIISFVSFNTNILNGLANGISYADYVIPPYLNYWMPKRIEINEHEKKKWILISGFLQRCDHFASYCEEMKSQDEIEIEILSYDKIKENITYIINEKTKQTDSSLWQIKKLEENNRKEGSIILIAPTGCGKTEFSFLWSNGKKFFYTLPLRAAVEQIYERAKNIFGDDKTSLLHSDADVYLLGHNNELEKLKIYELAKHLSFPAMISTGDQFFPYALRPPGYERIYSAFTYSRLIIDEVQAYDPKASAIIVKFIEDIKRLGGEFLLMTATLPDYIKTQLERRIGPDDSQLINLYEDEKEKYDRFIKHHIEFCVIENSKHGKRPDYTIKNDIIEEIITLGSNNRVLVVLNTVNQAKKVYETIIGKNKKNNFIKEDNIILFHSQFTINQKNKIRQQIEKLFSNPKPKDDNEGKILVATQVVEAALDLDADYLFTEIAPMDALIQRMGRVCRRYRNLDDIAILDIDNSNVKIIVFENGFESGNKKIYDVELLEKTLILFNNKIKNTELNFDDYYGKKSVFKSENIFKKDKNLKLSEYDKYDLVKKLYENLNPDGNYLSEFYKTLDILDAGFMSDRRQEAQKIFREILNVSIIPGDEKERFLKELKAFIDENQIVFALFKKKIIAEFVIGIPYYTFTKSKSSSIENWVLQLDITESLKKKILRWLEGIYILDYDIENII